MPSPDAAPPPSPPSGDQPLLLDEFLADFDVSLAVHRIVHADRATTFAAARHLDFLSVRSPLVDAAIWARGLPMRLKGEAVPTPASMRLADAVESGSMDLPGWTLLGERPGWEIAFGAVGRFWQPDIEWHDVPAENLAAFDEPGWGKIAASFSVLPYGPQRTVLTYDCRVATTDDAARRRFGHYWKVIRPFVGHIFRATLNTIAHDAEQPAATAHDAGPVTDIARDEEQHGAPLSAGPAAAPPG